MKEKIPADEYLKKVLQKWTAFCKSHKRFKTAIIEILKENEQLKAQVKNLSERT